MRRFAGDFSKPPAGRRRCVSGQRIEMEETGFRNFPVSGVVRRLHDIAAQIKGDVVAQGRVPVVIDAVEFSRITKPKIALFIHFPNQR